MTNNISADIVRQALGAKDAGEFLTSSLLLRSFCGQPVLDDNFYGRDTGRNLDGALVVRFFRSHIHEIRDWSNFNWIFELKPRYFQQVLYLLRERKVMSKLSGHDLANLNCQIAYFATNHRAFAARIDTALVFKGLAHRRMSPAWRGAVEAACSIPIRNCDAFLHVMDMARHPQHSARALQTIARAIWSRRNIRNKEFYPKCRNNQELIEIARRHATDPKSSARVDAGILLGIITNENNMASRTSNGEVKRSIHR